MKKFISNALFIVLFPVMLVGFIWQMLLGAFIGGRFAAQNFASEL
jgi:hypothetical protein